MYMNLWVAVLMVLGIFLIAPLLLIAGLLALWYHWLWTALVLLALAGYAGTKTYFEFFPE